MYPTPKRKSASASNSDHSDDVTFDDEPQISDLWRLCDHLTVKQASLLLVGIDPASEIGTYIEGWKPHERPKGYEAVKQAISSGLRGGFKSEVQHLQPVRSADAKPPETLSATPA